MATFFSDYFGVPEDVMTDFGVLNVSLVNDLPLFIDPFLLFHSEKADYQKLHGEMIQYVTFLRDHSRQATANEDLLKAWYCFPEIKQNWLGFSVSGNSGSGLGMKFARALSANLGRLFSDFGSEKITEGIRYIYDFGDDWVHRIEATIIGEPTPGNLYPRLVDVTGRCPPEDVGGLLGYEHFLDAIGDPGHPEHDELTQWAGGPFDPHTPDADELRLEVLKLAKKWKPGKK